MSIHAKLVICNHLQFSDGLVLLTTLQAAIFEVVCMPECPQGCLESLDHIACSFNFWWFFSLEGPQCHLLHWLTLSGRVSERENREERERGRVGGEREVESRGIEGKEERMGQEMEKKREQFDKILSMQ